MGIRPHDNSCEHIVFVGWEERPGDKANSTGPRACGSSPTGTMRWLSPNIYAHYLCVFSLFADTVDGTPVEPMETAGRFIALPLRCEHDLCIQARLSPLRRVYWFQRRHVIGSFGSGFLWAQAEIFWIAAKTTPR